MQGSRILIAGCGYVGGRLATLVAQAGAEVFALRRNAAPIAPGVTTVRADLAVTPSLASVVPPDLDILPADAGLPELPNFAISLFMRENHGDRAVDELAGHIRRVFVNRSRYSAIAAE